MTNRLRSVLIFLMLIGLISCGHKKNPTGGKKDTIQPEIISVIPDEYSDINGSNIEVVFSKPIERKTILSGIYIYPPILLKKYKWDGNILTIKILEELEKNTNYYFTFSEQIKGEHGNFINKTSTLIFASGQLNSKRISGNFLFEDSDDKNELIEITLFTEDSTKVYSEIVSGETYLIEDLNDTDHIIQAYIDKNTNDKYDADSEPYFHQLIDNTSSSLIDIFLAYADTVKPKLKSIDVICNNCIEVEFTESIASISEIYITTYDSLKTEINIITQYSDNDKLTILTSELDTLDYKIQLNNILDFKNNLTTDSFLLFEGIALQDTIPPEVISSSPRTGSSVETTLPKISILFSEIIFEEDIEAELVEVETGKIEDIVILNKDSKQYIFGSQHHLNNYSSYKFTLQVKDNSGNIMLKPFETIFLPIDRNID